MFEYGEHYEINLGAARQASIAGVQGKHLNTKSGTSMFRPGRPGWKPSGASNGYRQRLIDPALKKTHA